jgi:hypothetical protein
VTNHLVRWYPTLAKDGVMVRASTRSRHECNLVPLTLALVSVGRSSHGYKRRFLNIVFRSVLAVASDKSRMSFARVIFT